MSNFTRFDEATLYLELCKAVGVKPAYETTKLVLIDDPVDADYDAKEVEA